MRGGGTPKHGAAMTFTEIGQAMGFSTQRAQKIYSTAMRKLRRVHGKDVAALVRLMDMQRDREAGL